MAKLIDGKEIAQKFLDEVALGLRCIKEKDAGFTAMLAIVQVV